MTQFVVRLEGTLLASEHGPSMLFIEFSDATTGKLYSLSVGPVTALVEDEGEEEA